MAWDYYEILGLRKGCSKEDIKKAYLNLAKKYHPDINDQPDAEEQFKLVNEAYSVLYDDTKREEFEVSFEDILKAEAEFKVQIKYIDVFIRYIGLMQKYRPLRKTIYEIVIEDIYANVLEATFLDYDVEDRRIRSGTIVSIRLKGVLPEGKSLSEFSALGMIFLVRGDKVCVEILDTKQAKLVTKNRARLILEEDVRFLFSNIQRHMNLIIDNPIKYKKFRSLLTDIYTDGALGLPEIGIYEPTGTSDIQFIDDLNNEQKEVVKKTIEIYNNPDGYVLAVTGPGGTGKTKTTVEIIRQLIKLKPEMKILVTSFTNVAVDNVFAVLLKEEASLREKMIRVAFEQRIRLKDVKTVCLSKKRKDKKELKIDIIKKHNIVGATLDKLGTPLFDNFEFDLAIIDECSMIEFSKIMLVAAKTQKMLLIGDAYQLNPFLDDNVKQYLKRNGLTSGEIEHLEKSFFSDLVLYLNTTKSSALVKLICQHRSYPEIIKFSNDMFYNNILHTKITEYQLQKYNFLSKINFDNNLVKDVIDPKKRVVWIDLVSLPYKLKYSSNKDWADKFPGRQMRYFHIAQAAITIILLKRYLEAIYYSQSKTEPEYREKIGVIAPYNDQVELIRKYLYENPSLDPYLRDKIKEDPVNKALIKAETYMLMTDLEVGTVHKFQGREKDIIIFDITSYTGVGDPKILQDYKILNVAVTRAKCKLIIIGTVRPDLNYYSDLHDEKYAHIIGAKGTNRESLNKRIGLLKQLGAYKADSCGAYYDKDIMEYLHENKQLGEEFKSLIDTFGRIENQIIEADIGYDSLSEEEEYDHKLDELYKIIDLSIIKESLLEKLQDPILKTEARKIFPSLNDYVKNEFANSGLNQKTVNQIRKQLVIFLEEDGQKFIEQVAQINKQEELRTKIDKFGEVTKNTKPESIVNYMAFVSQVKLKKLEKHIRYKKKLEGLLKIDLRQYFDILSLNTSEEKKQEIIKKIDDMPKSMFESYGVDLCKTLIMNKTFKANHSLEWLEKVVRVPIKEGWAVDVWLALRSNYDKRFGREDI
ncbi:DnaJ domain-containing protein [Candidatus Woesearchaeota archaeon]|nr:DnaJ domain-containing protein [Candidatus Woesearchaeota archaeon]